MSLAVSTNDLSADVGRRVAAFLRARYADTPHGAGSRAKQIARDLDVSEATAKRWLAGHVPATPHLLAMLVHYGVAFAAEVLRPTGECARAMDFGRQVTTLHQAVDEIGRVLRDGPIRNVKPVLRLYRRAASAKPISNSNPNPRKRASWPRLSSPIA